MSKHRVLSLKPQLRLEWRGQDGQNETEQPDHSASLSDSITASTRIRFSVHTRAEIGILACSKCGNPMRLSQIEPAAPRYDVRTFECAKCDSSVRFSVGI